MQPIVDASGVIRFQGNTIVRRLLDRATELGYDLNRLAVECSGAPQCDKEQSRLEVMVSSLIASSPRARHFIEVGQAVLRRAYFRRHARVADAMCPHTIVFIPQGQRSRTLVQQWIDTHATVAAAGQQPLRFLYP